MLIFSIRRNKQRLLQPMLTNQRKRAKRVQRKRGKRVQRRREKRKRRNSYRHPFFFEQCIIQCIKRVQRKRGKGVQRRKEKRKRRNSYRHPFFFEQCIIQCTIQCTFEGIIYNYINIYFLLVNTIIFI